MADPDGAVAVRGAGAMAAPDDPDELVAQIERTRENLARTIDTLADRVSPANNVRRLRAQVEEQAARPEVRLAAAAAGFAVISLIVYRKFGRRK
jgi:Protein of unknown function (DUF3618)